MTTRFVPARSLAVAAGLLVASAAHAQDKPPTTPPSTPPATEPSARAVVRDVERDEASKPTPDPIERIKEEAAKNSQVMATLSYLTDVIGPRLTGSPNMKRANEWTRDKMTSWGMQNAHLESWGPFGKSWSLEKFSIQVSEPQCIPLIAFPKAWSPGLDGTVTGPLIDIDAVKTPEDLDKLKGKLKGAYLMMSAVQPVEAHFEAEGTRLTDKELLELANAPDPATRRTRTPRNQPTPPTVAGQPAAAGQPAPAAANRPGFPAMTDEMRNRQALQRRAIQMATDEGAAALIDGSRIGDGGTLFVAQASVPTAGNPGERGANARRVSAWDKDAPKLLPQITVAKEHYNRLLRMLHQGESLKITAELAVKFYDNAETFNTVAEIPGTDPKLKDEVVMLGGHMDSWHSGTGATDNAAGVSVAMEAARILKTLDLKPKRTIRVALWSGEEQGLYGSRGYVKEHFGYAGDGTGMGGGGGGGGGGANGGGSPPKITVKPEYEKFSGYFNLDNGTGKIRGVYLQGNEAVRTVFQPWLAPFREMGAATITVSNTGGTDHQSFDAIGLPGFQFIQDVIEYDARTHHSNQDVFDRIQADDMKQASAIMAAFVLNTANRDEKLPRKPTPNLVPATPSSSPTPAPPANPVTTPAAASASNFR